MYKENIKTNKQKNNLYVKWLSHADVPAANETVNCDSQNILQDEICITNNSFIVLFQYSGSEHSVPLWFLFSYRKKIYK